MRMAREQLLRLIEELLEVPAGSLTGAEMLESLEGWNSMAMLGFMAIADEHCGLTLSPRKFVGCRTVNDLMDLLQVAA
jgi:acyl carrier protein